MQPGLARVGCPRCGASLSSGSVSCAACDASLDDGATRLMDDDDGATRLMDDDDNATRLMDENATVALDDATVVMDTTASVRQPVSYDSLGPGTVIGGRYEILRLLGSGGMGAVYQARDREVDRIVAFKVIRPEMASDPNILHMFKQELVLARQITHANVIRIYDLGVADGLRFITMEFVEGTDLDHMIEDKGKFSPKEAAGIIAQVCQGLEAAHRENVVHRDLKPQNVMIDAQGKAYVMDFGLAHSTETGGSEGKLLGTPNYMSPEQAKRLELDPRSDLFTVGIIFYQMLTGELPLIARSLKETLRKRINQRVPPPIANDPTIPKALNAIVVKCTAPDPADRYQTAAEIVHDLHVWMGLIVPSNTKLWKRVSVACLAIAIALSGYAVTVLQRRPPVAQKPVTLLVADFDNKTGDAVLNGTLEPLFGLAAEGASFISAYNRVAARQIAGQVQPGATHLDESVARLVAIKEGVNVVVSGSIARSGGAYVISANALDAVTGKKLRHSEVEVPSKEKLPGAMAKLAQPIRKALGDQTKISDKAEAGETFTAASLEAAHDYSLGQDAQLSAKYDDALRYYEKAVALDPTLGRAYSGMGVIYRNRDDREEAEKYLKIALSHIGQMSERERFRTRGAYYVTIGSIEKAADEYSTLVKQFPADNAGHANLAICYSYLRNLPRAIEEGRKAIEIYGKNVAQRNNLAGYLLYAGKFDDAFSEAGEVLKLNPAFERAYVLKALASLAKGDTQQAIDLYEQAGKASRRGASYRSIGLAGVALYQGRASEATSLLQQGIQADLAADKPEWAASKYASLANAQWMLGRKAAAVSAAEKAISSTKEDSVRFLAARTLVEAGQDASALTIARALSKSLDNEPQAYGKLIEGELALKHGASRDAIKVIQDAQKLLDTWIGRVDLGRAFLSAEAYTEADSEFDACLRRRGEATALFLDVLPTYEYFPQVYYYIGVAQQGLGSPSAAQSFQTFLKIKAKSGADPLVSDAKKRLAK